MIKIIKRIANKLGIDRAISYVLIGRGFSFLSQPITLYLIAKYFTAPEQGYYYTFGSILSASVFLELGLGVVLTQFASHEFAYLSWNEDGSLLGDKDSLSRLLSILRKSLKWYGVLSVLYFLILIPVGIIFFGSSPDATNVNFLIPWIFLVFFNSLGLFIYPILAIIEGCGKVAELQKMKFYQLSLGAVSVWLIIFMKGGLLAATILAFTNFLVSIIWLNNNFKGLILQLRLRDNKFNYHQISWRYEIMPMQWRIALSWTSGYIIFQLFNPLLFKYQGATVAGQMGMSLSVANAIQNTSMAWISTKVPLYGSLIKKKKYNQLDNIYLNSTKHGITFALFLSIFAIIFIYFIKIYFPSYGDRILSVESIAALFFANIINIKIFSIAGYLRAHKEEPFLINSLVTAFVMVIVSWYCARYLSVEILCYSIAAINLFIGLPMAFFIFKKKRIDWGVDKY